MYIFSFIESFFSHLSKDLIITVTIGYVYNSAARDSSNRKLLAPQHMLVNHVASNARGNRPLHLLPFLPYFRQAMGPEIGQAFPFFCFVLFWFQSPSYPIAIAWRLWQRRRGERGAEVLRSLRLFSRCPIMALWLHLKTNLWKLCAARLLRFSIVSLFAWFTNRCGVICLHILCSSCFGFLFFLVYVLCLYNKCIILWLPH